MEDWSSLKEAALICPSSSFSSNLLFYNLTLKAVSIEQVLALLVTLDSALRTTHSLPNQTQLELAQQCPFLYVFAKNVVLAFAQKNAMDIRNFAVTDKITIVNNFCKTFPL